MHYIEKNSVNLVADYRGIIIRCILELNYQSSFFNLKRKHHENNTSFAGNHRQTFQENL